jgi:hypothetical protein
MVFVIVIYVHLGCPPLFFVCTNTLQQGHPFFHSFHQKAKLKGWQKRGGVNVKPAG